MAWQDALQETPEGVRLLLSVVPGAKDPAFPAGHDPWRGRIRIRVAAAAQGGAANQEVIERVAAALGVAVECVVIVAGATDRRKTVAVRGHSRQEALASLAPLWR